MTAIVLHSDCLSMLARLPNDSVDAVVTDTPYGLSHEPDAAEMLRHWITAELRAHAVALGLPQQWVDHLYPQIVYTHGGSGFMGKAWDSFVPGPEVWREVLRVMKPGAHALAFGGTRTYDLMVLAMRIAGLEIRDQLAWVYGTGFPKSNDFACDFEATRTASKAAGFEVRVLRPEFVGHEMSDGWGTALKPALEPICLARKPLIGTIGSNVLAHGTGALHIDACRVGDSGGTHGSDYAKTGLFGIGGKGTIEEIDAGRWPANLILDHDAAAWLDSITGYMRDGIAVRRNVGHSTAHGSSYAVEGSRDDYMRDDVTFGGGGGASRFFYVAKPGKREKEAGLDHLPMLSGGELTDRRDGSDGLKSPRAGAGRGGGRRNNHPTVKPIDLARYLVRLVCPRGGTVLDPYTGSGTHGIAAHLEGCHFIGSELEAYSVTIARSRIAHWARVNDLTAA